MQRLLPSVEQRPAPVLVHNDVHPWNVLVTPHPPRLAALLDWGDGGLGDRSLDLAAMPLRLTLPLVQAYKSAGGQMDDGFEGRVLVSWLAGAMWEMRDLGSESFARDWWRWPIGGVPEFQALTRTWPEEWRQWVP